MAASAVGSFCSLCMRCKLIKLDCVKQDEMLDKISKYLFMRIEQDSFALCEYCFKSLEDFHSFYERVRAAQKDLCLPQNGDPGLKVGVRSASTQTYDSETVWVGQESDSETGEHDSEQGDDPLDGECSPELEQVSEGEKDNDSKDVSNAEESNTGGLSEQAEQEQSGKKPKLSEESGQKRMSNEIEKKMMEFYNIKCEKCEDIKFTSFKMLSRHYTTVHNIQGYIKCCKRNIRVNDKSYLRSHMLRHLEPDTCRCSVCGKQLSSSVMLKHHMILHKPAEERPFQCAQCDKRFCCKNDLKNHEKAIHVAEEKRQHFICDVCGKVFQKIANFRYHHATKHRQEKKYVCELCAKCFTTQRGLRTHMTAAHNTKGPIQCQECGKWLKNEDTFQRHLQLHRNHSYPCSQCNKVCKSSTSLRSHMKKHSHERPYMCDACGKSFKTKTYLKNHMAQHTGGSNYKCPYCSKTFVNMSNFYTHRKRMHSNEKTNPTPGPLMEIEEDACASVEQEAQPPAQAEGQRDESQVIVIRENIIVAPGMNIIKFSDFE